MLPHRNVHSKRTKSLTWWANDKPEIETLLRELLERKSVALTTLRRKSSSKAVHLVCIFLHDHGNAEDFHFGQFNSKQDKLNYELDLTRIAAHGRKQRLNCAMEETQVVSLEELREGDRLVSVASEEYQTLVDTVINKLY